jgi:hypothetical protein
MHAPPAHCRHVCVQVERQASRLSRQLFLQPPLPPHAVVHDAAVESHVARHVSSVLKHAPTDAQPVSAGASFGAALSLGGVEPSAGGGLSVVDPSAVELSGRGVVASLPSSTVG